MATSRTPISPVLILQGAPLSWSLLSEHSSSVVVSVTTRHERANGCREGSYLLTAEMEVVRDSWEQGALSGPLDNDDAAEVVADVQRFFESGRGVLFMDLPIVADAEVRS